MEIDRIRWDKFSDPLFDRRWRRLSAEGTRRRLSQSGVISVIERGGNAMCAWFGEAKESRQPRD